MKKRIAAIIAAAGLCAALAVNVSAEKAAVSKCEEYHIGSEFAIGVGNNDNNICAVILDCEYSDYKRFVKCFKRSFGKDYSFDDESGYYRWEIEGGILFLRWNAEDNTMEIVLESGENG